MWLWELKDLAVIGISVLLSIVILTQTKLMLPLVASALYAFLSMRFDGTSILDFIDNDGTLTEESFHKILVDTGIGAIGGIAGGNGAIRGNKYMARQGSRLLSHVGTDGAGKAFSFYYKMTANYSKQFVKSTLIGIARGYTGGRIAREVFA